MISFESSRRSALNWGYQFTRKPPVTVEPPSATSVELQCSTRFRDPAYLFDKFNTAELTLICILISVCRQQLLWTEEAMLKNYALIDYN